MKQHRKDSLSFSFKRLRICPLYENQHYLFLAKLTSYLKKIGLQRSVHIESRVTTADIRCSRQKSQSLIPCSESRNKKFRKITWSKGDNKKNKKTTKEKASSFSLPRISTVIQ
jgi:hypothetical protein